MAKIDVKDGNSGADEQNDGGYLAMSNKMYDVLKVIALVVLPLCSMLVVGLSDIWGWGWGVKIDETIQLLIAMCNFALGAVLVKSSNDYNKQGDA